MRCVVSCVGGAVVCFGSHVVAAAGDAEVLELLGEAARLLGPGAAHAHPAEHRGSLALVTFLITYSLLHLSAWPWWT